VYFLVFPLRALCKGLGFQSVSKKLKGEVIYENISCRRWGEYKESNKKNEDDEIEGLEVGANDYLKKPFSLKILITRVKKLLNLIGGRKRYGALDIDLSNHKVYIKGEDINISPKEFELLNYLILNGGIVLNRGMYGILPTMEIIEL